MKKNKKPVLACWMGGNRVAEAQALFAEYHVPHFESPETAIEAFSFLARHLRNQRLLMQSPGPLSHEEPPDVEGARLIIEGVMAEGRKILGIIEAKAILAAFRIPTMQAVLARTPNEALMAAEALGFPVVVKINSPDLENKSDVDGVVLNIADAQSVRRTYTEIVERAKRLRPDAAIEGVTVEHMVSKRAARELMVGVNRDPIFGPVISFGAGGTEVEMLEDRALGLPPLNAFIIQTMIDHTRVARLMGALQQIPPMNRVALAQDPAARLRDGLRAARDHLHGDQPTDRQRQGGASRWMPASRSTIARPSRPPMATWPSTPIRPPDRARPTPRRQGPGDPPDPPGGRRDDAGVRPRALRADQVFPLHAGDQGTDPGDAGALHPDRL